MGLTHGEREFPTTASPVGVVQGTSSPWLFCGRCSCPGEARGLRRSVVGGGSVSSHVSGGHCPWTLGPSRLLQALPGWGRGEH